MVPPLQYSTYLDLTSYGTTTATTVRDAYGLFGPVTKAPTVKVALILPRANDPMALLTSDWGTRQTTLAHLNDTGTLWSTYGATTSDYYGARSILSGLGITIIGDSAGSQGYVTSQDSRTIWVSLSSTQFSTLFGTQLLQSDSHQQGTLYYWDGSLTVPDGLHIAGVWMDTAPHFGTYPAVSDMSGGARVALQQGSQSIGNELVTTHQQTNNYSGDIANWFYHFPLAGNEGAPTATIGLLGPGLGDVLPGGAH